MRHVLCQAAWAALRVSPEWREYDRINRGSKSRGKIAIVAVMRQLAVTMWHRPVRRSWTTCWTRSTLRKPQLGLDKRGRPLRLRRRLGLKRVKAEATAKAEGASGSPLGCVDPIKS